MRFKHHLSLACPLDHLPLNVVGGQLKCTAGHSYDLASRGYANLLPVQFKRSLEPGDDNEMVQARRRVLDSGIFSGLAKHVTELAQPFMKSDSVLLDAGCGEGFYTHAFAVAFPEQGVVGVDISKDCIHAACGRSRDVTWIVGTNGHLPLLPQSVSVVTCLFGFPVWPEFSRVLDEGGIVIMVDPGPKHLIELRELLYETVRIKEDRPSNWQTKTVPLDTVLLNDLVAMTPHAHRAINGWQERVAAKAPFSLTLDLTVTVLPCTQLPKPEVSP
jgi:23S rRNA (guanine745-N1)-methyltransferase